MTRKGLLRIYYQVYIRKTKDSKLCVCVKETWSRMRKQLERIPKIRTGMEYLAWKHLPHLELGLLLGSQVRAPLLPTCFVLFFKSWNPSGFLHSSTVHQLRSLLCLFLSFKLGSLNSHLHSLNPCLQPFVAWLLW